MPTPGSLFGAILFGAIGMGAFVHGKRTASAARMLIGVALMGVPYFVSDALVLYLVGTLLCGGLYVFRH